jgi:hypothetical protein
MGFGSSRASKGASSEPLLDNGGAAPSAPPAPPQMYQAVVGGGGSGGNAAPTPAHYPGVPTPATGYPSSSSAPADGAVFFPPAPVVVEAHTHVHHTHVHPPPQLPASCPGCGLSGGSGGASSRWSIESGCCAWLSALALCFMCPCCFFVPFCTNCARDQVYRCSRCGAELGRTRPWPCP